MTDRSFSSHEYLAALTTDPALAILPFQMAADIWVVSRATISGMVTAGKLDDIKIGGTRYIVAKSLHLLIEQWQDEVSKIRKIIVIAARKGQTLYYAPLMESIGLSSTVPADRKRIGAILGEISRATYEENGTLITVIVHRQTSGKTNPGPGFFALADSLKLKRKDNKQFVDDETQKVWEHYLR